MESILKVSNVAKAYKSGNSTLEVLKNISFDIPQGSAVSIVGPSGSGKTTLLGLCAGLDNVTDGEVHLAGESLNSLTEDERASLRNQKVGFVFQSFNLLPTLTALENVMVPLELLKDKNAKKKAQHLLEQVGLGDRLNHYTSQLSGGEQQRVSIARAFANEPDILFADEPTGNLDEETGTKVEDLLFQLNQERGTTLILVTHDLNLAERTDRILQIKGGSLSSDEPSKAKKNTMQSSN